MINEMIFRLYTFLFIYMNIKYLFYLVLIDLNIFQNESSDFSFVTIRYNEM